MVPGPLRVVAVVFVDHPFPHHTVSPLFSET